MLDIQVLLPQIMRIAREAGDAILPIYNSNGAIDFQRKADTTPVTEADLEAHRLICTSLRRLTPEIPILSEESTADSIRDRRQWQRYWLVDPLDGTKEFIKRNGEFTVNIALVEDGTATLGAVHAPVSCTSWGGSLRLGAVKRDSRGREQPIRVAAITPFKPLSVVTSRSHIDPGEQRYIEQLRKSVPVSVTPIGSSLKLCLIAEGLADFHVRLGRTCEWDTAAAQAVLEAAGGRVVDLNFSPLRYNRRTELYNPSFIAFGDSGFGWSDCLDQVEAG